MNTTLTNLAIKTFGPKAIRSGLAWLAGLLAAYGVTLDTNSTYTFLGSLLIGAVVVIWSMLAKAKPSDELRDKIGDFCHAVVMVIMPAVLGFLKGKGITLTGDETAEQLIMLGLFTASSALNKPDAKTEKLTAPDPNKLKLPTALLLIAATLASGLLTSCKAYHRAAITATLRASCALMLVALSTSCMAAKGTGWAYASLGTNAERVEARDSELIVEGMNQTEGIKAGGGILTNLALTKGAYGLADTITKKTPDIVKSFSN